MNKYLLTATKLLPHVVYQPLQRWYRGGLGPSERKLIELIGHLDRSYPELAISVLDVGARYGLEVGGLGTLKDFSRMKLVGIEPDEWEAKRLEKEEGYAKVHPVGVWDYDGQATLHVTRHTGCTSVLEPNEQELARFRIAHWFEVMKRIPV